MRNNRNGVFLKLHFPNCTSQVGARMTAPSEGTDTQLVQSHSNILEIWYVCLFYSLLLMGLQASSNSSTFAQLFFTLLYSDIPFHFFMLPYQLFAICIVFNSLTPQNIKTCPISYYLFSSFSFSLLSYLLSSLRFCTILCDFLPFPVSYFLFFPISTIDSIFFFFMFIFVWFLLFSFSFYVFFTEALHCILLSILPHKLALDSME